MTAPAPDEFRSSEPPASGSGPAPAAAATAARSSATARISPGHTGPVELYATMQEEHERLSRAAHPDEPLAARPRLYDDTGAPATTPAAGAGVAGIPAPAGSVPDAEAVAAAATQAREAAIGQLREAVEDIQYPLLVAKDHNHPRLKGPLAWFRLKRLARKQGRLNRYLILSLEKFYTFFLGREEARLARDAAVSQQLARIEARLAAIEARLDADGER